MVDLYCMAKTTFCLIKLYFLGCVFDQWATDYNASSFCKGKSCSQQLVRAKNKLREFPGIPEERKYAIQAIFLYTDDTPKLHEEMNSVLRGYTIPDQDIFKRFADILIKAIDLICEQVNEKCVRNVEAFRGQKYKETFTLNTEYLFKSYTSTSTDITQALNFAKGGDGSVLFHISGVNGIFIEEYSRFEMENEILMKPGTTFAIDEINRSEADIKSFLKKYDGEHYITPQLCIELSKLKEPSAKCSSLTSGGVSRVNMHNIWLLKTISLIFVFVIYQNK